MYFYHFWIFAIYSEIDKTAVISDVFSDRILKRIGAVNKATIWISNFEKRSFVGFLQKIINFGQYLYGFAR